MEWCFWSCSSKEHKNHNQKAGFQTQKQSWIECILGSSEFSFFKTIDYDYSTSLSDDADVALVDSCFPAIRYKHFLDESAIAKAFNFRPFS